jgi:hypothetical protein
MKWLSVLLLGLLTTQNESVERARQIALDYTRAMTRKGDAVRTVVEFSNYHKFSTGVTLTIVNP